MKPPRPLDSAIIISALVVFVLSICQACDQTTPVYQVGAPSEGTPVTSTEPQVAEPSPESEFAVPEPTDFEDFLSGETLAKYESLPVEFQDALREEAEVSGHEKALQYLNNLPDDVIPLSELLEGWVLGDFEHLDASYQRLLLLEGYPYSTNAWLKWFKGEITEEDRFGRFGDMVLNLRDIVKGDGEVLPPIEETLSPEALAKLDAIDPVMRQSFRLIWESTRTHPRMKLAEELEQDLLAAPDDIPAIEDLALPAEAVELLDDMPDLKALAQQMIAADILRNQKWDEEDTDGIERFLARYYTQEGRAAFTHGLHYPEIHTSPLICQPAYTPLWGIAPTWAIPAPFRDVPWTHLMFRWPDHEQALSEEALSRLRSMDPIMQRTFEGYYYGTGPLPRDAGEMACSVAKWERGLIYAPFTSLPAPEELLSPEGLEMYRNLSASQQELIWVDIMFNIFKYGIVWNPETEEAVPTYGTSLEEILEVLKVQSEYLVRLTSERISHTE